MKYTLLFLSITYFFIAMQSCNAMKNENNTIIKKLKTAGIIRPYCAQYLTDNRVVIAHNYGCSLIDTKNGEEIQKISNVPCYRVAVHPDKKKIAFSDHKTIGLYNIETNKQEWLKPQEHHINSMHFMQDNTILLYLQHSNKHNYSIIKRDYRGNVCDDYAEFVDAVSSAFCLKKQVMCVLEQHGDILSLYNVSNLKLKPKKIVWIWDRLFCNLYNRCCISSEGIIVVGEVSSMLFYPNSSILLTINFDKKMRYWDVETQQPICTVGFPCSHQYIHDFSFSPDRKEVIFVFSKECLTSSVPFEVQYKCGTKEKFPYLLFLLKNYVHQQHQKVPEEIVRLLGCILLTMFKR